MGRATMENIQRLMGLTGVTQEALGDIAGVDRTSVSHWVTGRTSPRMGALQRIADHFGITTNNLADPGGMRYVYADGYGVLYEDLQAKLADMRDRIDLMEEGTLSASDLESYESAVSATSTMQRVSTEEMSLLRMYRSLDDRGRQVAMVTMASYTRSGMFGDKK